MSQTGPRGPWPEATEAALDEVIVAHAGGEGAGALLPMLHALQARFGHVPEGSVPRIAQALNISRAEVHGVITFYHDFRANPPGRQVLRLCRSEACLAMGAEDIAQDVRDRLGLAWGETSADGAVTLEPVYCLGLCACAPAAMLDTRPLGRVGSDALLAALAQGRTGDDSEASP